MKPRRTAESNHVFRLEGGNEDNDLWVAPGEDDSGNPIIISTWELTDEERQTIADGGTVDLMVWGRGHPPVALAVAPPLKERK